jgi:phosphoglycerate dehydrogenase-like enzyme
MKAVLPYDPTPSIRGLILAEKDPAVDIVLLNEADTDGFATHIRDAEMLLHVLAPVTAELMRAAPSLKLVQKIGIGVDAIDLEYAKAHGIAVCNMPGTNTAAVAELALGLMLTCLRRLVPIAQDMKASGLWPARPAIVDGAGEIGQRCVGLVGFGAVSRRLAPALQALDATVIAHDPAVTTNDLDVEMVALDGLLARADIVSLHVPLLPQTRNLLNKERIARMRPGAIVINTARGPLIDEAALFDALKRGHLGAAGLDVFEQEPVSADHPLLKLDNVVATPHIAWLTDGTWRRSLGIIVENARRLAAGTALLHRVA